MDLLFKALVKSGAPPIFNRPVMDLLAEKPLLPPVIFPDPYFTRARTDKSGRQMPQTIAHRGFKARYPENTMRSFQGAVDVGAHALETDVHLSKDGAVVLSHDPSLKRCFGADQKIANCDWEYLSTLRTIAEPHEPLPRLENLLQYLNEPTRKNIWLLLDIKISNEPSSIMRQMSEAFSRVPPSAGTRWEDRIVLGCWAAKFVPHCHEHFPGYSISNIGFSLAYSRQFFDVPNCSFNILQASLLSPSGRNLIKEARQRHRETYSWTVNEEKDMYWCIRHGLDGVITDDPQMFLDVCRNYRVEHEPPWATSRILSVIRINIFAFIFGLIFWLRHGFGLDGKYIDKRK